MKNNQTLFMIAACAASALLSSCSSEVGSAPSSEEARARSVPASAEVSMEVDGVPGPLLGRFTLVVRADQTEALMWHAATADRTWHIYAQFDLAPLRDQLRRNSGQGLSIRYRAANDLALFGGGGGQVSILDAAHPSPDPNFIQIRELELVADASGMLTVRASGPDAGRFRGGNAQEPVRAGTDLHFTAVGRLSVSCEAVLPAAPEGHANPSVNDPTFGTNPRCRELLDGWR